MKSKVKSKQNNFAVHDGATTDDKKDNGKKEPPAELM